MKKNKKFNELIRKIVIILMVAFMIAISVLTIAI